MASKYKEMKYKPMVLLNSGNPEEHEMTRQSLAQPENQVGDEWAGSIPTQDNAPALTDKQVQEFKDNGTITKTGSAAPAKTATNNSQPKKYDGWDDILAAIEENKAYRIRTPEEIERQRKADKRNALFAAIGDGVSALSNLYFTTKGAPSVESNGKTLSEAQQAASDKWWKDEKEAREAYIRNRLAALRLRQQKDYYDWRQQNGDDRLTSNNQYKQDRLTLDKEREARLKRQQQLKESEAEFKALALSGKLNQQQWAAIQRWYSAATKGNPGPFPNVGADVQQALLQRYPNAFEGVAFTQQPTAPAVAPTVTVTPKNNKRGSSGGRGGRGGAYNPARDPNMEKITYTDEQGRSHQGWQRKNRSGFVNTRELAKKTGL